MKVPYVEDNPEKGGLVASTDDAIAQMIRDGVQSWQPKRGADWAGLLLRVSGAGPSPWVTYAVSSAALVIILISAVLLGSALHLGALAPQPIQSHLP